MRARLLAPTIAWSPLSIDGAFGVQTRLEGILERWRNTPYLSGQRCCGEGADCIGFVFGVVDELDGRPRASSPLLPRDTSLHDAKGAFRAVVALRRLYAPVERLRRPPRGGRMFLEPGDLLVVGPGAGGPGHLMLVGPRKNTIWHAAPGSGVHEAGWMLGDGYDRLFAVYRLLDRDRWRQQ